MAWVSKFYRSDKSKSAAKRRLKLVLMHDRAGISPDVLDRMKKDLIRVVKKYIDIDDQHLDMKLNESDRTVELVANIPIKGVREKKVA